MIESTFWQEEELPDLEQGLWDNIGYYKHWIQYRYILSEVLYFTIAFNRMSGKFDYYYLPEIDFGLTKDD